MEKAKLNRKAIIDIFDLEQSVLFDVDEWITVDQEELSGQDIDTLMDTLCDGENDILKYYTKFTKIWGDPDDTYELKMSNGDEGNELTLRTVLFTDPRDPDLLIIDRDKYFTSIDLFNIISAINSQVHFYDLYIAVEKDSDSGVVNGTVYHGESFANYKTWIGDLMDMFRKGELENYHRVVLSSELCQIEVYVRAALSFS